MKTTKNILGLGLAVLALVFTSAQAQAQACTAATYKELTDAEKTSVQNGERLMCLVNASNSRWPKVYVYKMMKSTPEEAMAVFADYESSLSYLHGLLKNVKVLERSGPKARVYYKADSGSHFVSDPYYTVDNIVSIESTTKAYRMDWSLVEGTANMSDLIEGYARFETTGTGTLLSYYNFVNPTSSFASIGHIKNEGLKKMGYTVDRVASHIEEVVANDRATLDKEIADLRKSLSQ